MAINFPSAPGEGDSHTEGAVTWIYNGSAWDSLYQPTAKDQVGLGNVDNTSDEDKPVSTAQQAALDALTKDDVGLDNVDNTSDMNKPVSTAQQAAIDAAGGSSFDQDLNTTDSPTFATLTTTDTITTDVYTTDASVSGTITAANVVATSDIISADISASGTVTAGDVSTSTVTSAGSLDLQSSGVRIARAASSEFRTYKDLKPSSDNSLNLGDATKRWATAYTQDLDATGTVKKGVFTVATLPTGEAGMTCFVSDANATTRGSTVAGGGANFMPVYSDGTNWIIS